MRRAYPSLLGLSFVLALACSDSGGRPQGTGYTGATLSGGVSTGGPLTETGGDGDPSTTDPSTSDPSTTRSGDGDGEGEPLPCDPGFAFSPDPPGTGALLNVAFTDAEPLAYVDIEITGPGVAAKAWAGISSEDPWTWNWTVTDLAPGVWTFTFGAGEMWAPMAACEVEVLDTGLPPPLPMGACEGKVCGESDGMGGTCQTCPMVGDCLDPPSPYGPNGPMQWSCLDSASCEEGNGTCRIWCPGEPCNDEAHPDGCPQGVESCWVDASISSYEQACKTCCESRFHEPTQEYACWDEAYNLCRYPSDCGLPLW